MGISSRRTDKSDGRTNSSEPLAALRNLAIIKILHHGSLGRFFSLLFFNSSFLLTLSSRILFFCLFFLFVFVYSFFTVCVFFYHSFILAFFNSFLSFYFSSCCLILRDAPIPPVPTRGVCCTGIMSRSQGKAHL